MSDVLPTNSVIVVYVDGSFWQAGFGTPSNLECDCRVRAGYGIYFPADYEMNDQFHSGRAPHYVRTNNDAEIYAIIKAMELCENRDSRLFVYTDSLNTVRMVEEYNIWQRNYGYGYGPVLNKLFQNMAFFNTRPELVYVRGHSGNHGNDTAHELAHQGMRESCCHLRCIR
ncbi:ribonuclease H-like protein [Meira miltonrushii]|uniref:ribonuclease H n=1 Tax=Meira miltonrushii TaxID=1280837 RepID=A0A316V6M5_9BASI|nr:ribonuclease H-like protein [Meira miltonrushii]PWN33072.1 ribonuclease H-like protein [Meira miltonrushii]